MADRNHCKVKTKTSHWVLEFDVNNFSTVFPQFDLCSKERSGDSGFPSLRSKKFQFVKSFMEIKDVEFQCEIVLCLNAFGSLVISAEFSYPSGVNEPTRVSAIMELHNADGKPCQVETYMGQMIFDGHGSSTRFWGQYPFDDLFSQRATYLADDVLRIRIKFNFTESEYAETYGNTMLREGAVASLIQGLSSLRANDKDDSDFIIICGSEKFPTHKAILSARSPVFARMFASEMKENKSGSCEITDVEPSVFSGLLDFIYKVEMPSDSLDVGTVCGIAMAADKYEIPELQNYCLNQLMEKLTCKNFGQIAMTFYFCYDGKKRQEMMWEFCSRNWMELRHDVEFVKLTKDYPDAFFSPVSKN